MISESQRHSVIATALMANEGGSTGNALIAKTSAQTHVSRELVGEILTEYQTFHPNLNFFRKQEATSRSQALLARLEKYNLKYFDLPDFHQLGAAQEILSPMPGCAAPRSGKRAAAGLPPFLAALYDFPLLTREQEFHLFRALNYQKFCASELCNSLSNSKPSAQYLKKMEGILNSIDELSNTLLQRNLRMVVNIAKKYVNPYNDLFDLISVGYTPLQRAIEGFDIARGNKFSTYGYPAIVKEFKRHLGKQISKQPPIQLSEADAEVIAIEPEPAFAMNVERRQGLINFLNRELSSLDERQQDMIKMRFGLQPYPEPMVLQDIGTVHQVTKERVRQVVEAGLVKLLTSMVQGDNLARVVPELELLGFSGATPPSYNYPEEVRRGVLNRLEHDRLFRSVILQFSLNAKPIGEDFLEELVKDAKGFDENSQEVQEQIDRLLEGGIIAPAKDKFKLTRGMAELLSEVAAFEGEVSGTVSPILLPYILLRTAA